MTTPNPFDQGTGYPSLSFKDMPGGTSYAWRVVEAPKMLQARDYDTDGPKFWPAKAGQDPDPVMAVVVNVEVTGGPRFVGENRSIWAEIPSALFTALKDALSVTGKLIEMQVGGTGTLTHSSSKPASNPKFNDQKIYTATYQAPNAFAAPAQPAAPVVAAPVVQPAPVVAAPIVISQPAPVVTAAPVAQPAPGVPPHLVGLNLDVDQLVKLGLMPAPVAEAAPEHPVVAAMMAQGASREAALAAAAAAGVVI